VTAPSGPATPRLLAYQYHLREVLTKLEISFRRDLRQALPGGASARPKCITSYKNGSGTGQACALGPGKRSIVRFSLPSFAAKGDK